MNLNDESKQEATVSQSKPSGRARSAQSARWLIRRAKQASRRKFPAEENIRILLEGIRGEVGISELSRREGIHDPEFIRGSAVRSRREVEVGHVVGAPFSIQ